MIYPYWKIKEKEVMFVFYALTGCITLTRQLLGEVGSRVFQGFGALLLLGP